MLNRPKCSTSALEEANESKAEEQSSNLTLEERLNNFARDFRRRKEQFDNLIKEIEKGFLH